jgi:hypothetical protein
MTDSTGSTEVDQDEAVSKLRVLLDTLESHQLALKQEKSVGQTQSPGKWSGDSLVLEYVSRYGEDLTQEQSVRDRLVSTIDATIQSIRSTINELVATSDTSARTITSTSGDTTE